eukprot:gene26550-32594_t
MAPQPGVYEVKGEAEDDNGTSFPCKGQIQLFGDGSVAGLLNDAPDGCFGGSSLIVDGTWENNEVKFELRDQGQLETYKYEGEFKSAGLFNRTEGTISGEWQLADWPTQLKTQGPDMRGSFEFETLGPNKESRRKYEIRIITGNEQWKKGFRGPGTGEYKVWIQLMGDEGNSLPVQLREENRTTKNAEFHLMNQDDGHHVEVDADIGRLHSVTVGHDVLGEKKGWYLSRVEVRDEAGFYMVFPFERWIDAGLEDKEVLAMMPAKCIASAGGDEALQQELKRERDVRKECE